MRLIVAERQSSKSLSCNSHPDTFVLFIEMGCMTRSFFFLPADEGAHPGDGQTVTEEWVVKNVVKFICLQIWPHGQSWAT